MAAAGIVAVLGSVAIGQVLSAVDHSRGYAAARYLGARLGLARSQAVARGAAVALRFDQDSRGFSFSVFQDGNGNGVRTADIQAGIDLLLEPASSLFERFPGVDIGLSVNAPAPDPIQLGRTNLLTFTPMGTATSGTIYIRDRQGSQWAVRVLGATGRTRVLRYEPQTRAWLVAQ
jgi:Tfp pilus assembly protein FimT